jgi:hypothetical protein
MQFPCEDIPALAARFPDTSDERCHAAGVAARARGYYERDELILICAWKTRRSASKVAANATDAITRTTNQALTVEDEAKRMEALLELSGVGVPTASTLLHFAFPQDYPILDIRALEALGVPARASYPISLLDPLLDPGARNILR